MPKEPTTVVIQRYLDALANQHMRWQLDDLARRLDNQPAAVELSQAGVAAPPGSTGTGLTLRWPE
jgi:RNA polymerase sigma-70 factor (ECF subfamily)